MNALVLAEPVMEFHVSAGAPVVLIQLMSSPKSWLKTPAWLNMRRNV